LSAFASWLLGLLLDWLLRRATAAVGDAVRQLEEDKKRNETNAANLAAYQEAKDRADRIRAAQNLLNGTPP
jgi:hypothetical protein